jgi:MFS family permease
MNQQAASKTPSYAWVVLFAVYMASLAAPLNLFKVPPMLTTIADPSVFNLNQSVQGYVMSVFSIMGFVLAIPAGFILRRFGIKLTVLFAVAALMIGSAIGAVAHTVTQLFLGRFIEGAGMGLIMVSAPLAISLWFPADKRAFPMGLWASCIGVGSTAMLVIGPMLAAPAQIANATAKDYHWQSVWWLGSIFSAVAFVVFAALFRLPKPEEAAEPPAPVRSNSEPAAPVSLTKAMANRNLWLLSISFLCFNLVIMALTTFYPAFLEGIKFTKERASFITSMIWFIAIFSSPLGSYISDRMRSRKVVIVVPFIAIALLFLIPFSIPGSMAAAYMIVLGIFMGPIAPVILAAVPEVMKSPSEIGIGMGVAALGQNLGMFLGPVMFAKIWESSGSLATAGFWMIPLCVLGIICGWLAKVR